MECSGMSEKCFFVMINVEIILLSKRAQNNAIYTTEKYFGFDRMILADTQKNSDKASSIRFASNYTLVCEMH